MTKPSTLILIVLAVGLFYTFTSPQYKEAGELQATASEYRNVLKNISMISESRDRLLESYRAIPKADAERLVKALPDSIDVVGLALDLDAIASKYGVSIDKVEVDSQSGQGANSVILPESGRPYEKAAVTFSFVSDYQDFMSLLTDVEKSLRIMDVKSASFRVSDTANIYEHKVTVETYWLK
jgi:Tfp pilus assembly protein PilO